LGNRNFRKQDVQKHRFISRQPSSRSSPPVPTLEQSPSVPRYLSPHPPILEHNTTLLYCAGRSKRLSENGLASESRDALAVTVGECGIPRPSLAEPSLSYEKLDTKSFRCTYGECESHFTRFTRFRDLQRHHRSKHIPKEILADPHFCRFLDCQRFLLAFDRKDKRNEHERRVHGQLGG